jgi:hypothetical protein
MRVQACVHVKERGQRGREVRGGGGRRRRGRMAIRLLKFKANPGG